MITLQQIKENKFVQEFINQSEKYLNAIGFTDHGRRHLSIVSDRARSLAKTIGLSEKDQEMCAIVGYCH
ncbi:MAG: phosphohydrolase, partial [Patescibacteria group bacterium]|nr:phosphohydrolase [Patescibacteria group bacterium]